MAVLPFEHDVHARLGGPTTRYVGHPLMVREADWRPWLRMRPEGRWCPGAFFSFPAVGKLNLAPSPVFREAVAIINREHPATEFLLPAVPHLRGDLEAAIADWAVRPLLICGEARNGKLSGRPEPPSPPPHRDA